MSAPHVSRARRAWPALCVLCVLYAPCVLSAKTAASTTSMLASKNYCHKLKERWLSVGNDDFGLPGAVREVHVNGTRARVELRGESGAARAAHALLHALLRHALRYTEHSVARDCRSLPLCEPRQQYQKVLMVNAALAWHGVRCEPTSKAPWPSLAGEQLEVLSAGAAPATRRLLAHTGAGAAHAHCRDLPTWDLVRDVSCGYIAPPSNDTTAQLPSDWPTCTCSPGVACIPVLVVQEEAGLERLLRELCARAAELRPTPALRLEPLRHDAALRARLAEPDAFLFVDYDLHVLDEQDDVRPAPPLPCVPGAACTPALDTAVSLFVADVRSLVQYAPRVLSLLRLFRPSVPLLDRVLRNSTQLGLEEAACEAALENEGIVGGWVAHNTTPVLVRIYSCYNVTTTTTIANIVNHHFNRGERWGSMMWNIVPINNCSSSSTEYVDKELQFFSRNWDWPRTAGLVVMGAAGAGPLETARLYSVPVMLVEGARGAGGVTGASVRAASPPAAPLAAALRRLLAECGWRRVALLREDNRTDVWELMTGAGGEALLTHEQVLEGARPDAALAALRARDARVVLLDAAPRSAARLLAAAQARGLTPAAGYAWLVLGAAGDALADWSPRGAFSYLTVSGWWRGGGTGGTGGPRAQLRSELDKALGPRWPPHAAPLVDALLLMATAIQDFLGNNPQYRHDIHAANYSRLLMEHLDNTTVEGLTHSFHRLAQPQVFVHRWNASGGYLLAAWPGGAAAPDLCDAVRDAAACYTPPFGPDPFAPRCHDVAFAVTLCVLALTLPALWAAAATRRARLRRRDHALEMRLLASGPSAAVAAAAAALAAHAVPRAELELLDELGAGHYGRVRLAVLRAAGSAPLAVAAKAPRADAAEDAEVELLREAALLATLKHNHVVRFAGVCFEGAPLVLMENAFYGDLQRYLRAHRPLAERARAGLPEPDAAHVAAPELTRLAREAAAALAYLTHCQLVHRDVRAANCLVDARRSLKLADFGMARRLDESDKQYLCRRRAFFPVLWMAPESLASGEFSAASDVWALGVLLLELATLGARPYGVWPAPRAVAHVRAGGTPPLPRDAAPSTRGVLAECWRREPTDRPSAAKLVDHLATNLSTLQPALAAPDEPAAGDADPPHAPASPDDNLYFDEWS